MKAICVETARRSCPAERSSSGGDRSWTCRPHLPPTTVVAGRLRMTCSSESLPVEAGRGQNHSFSRSHHSSSSTNFQGPENIVVPVSPRYRDVAINAPEENCPAVHASQADRAVDLEALRGRLVVDGANRQRTLVQVEAFSPIRLSAPLLSAGRLPRPSRKKWLESPLNSDVVIVAAPPPRGSGRGSPRRHRRPVEAPPELSGPNCQSRSGFEGPGRPPSSPSPAPGASGPPARGRDLPPATKTGNGAVPAPHRVVRSAGPRTG